MSCCKKSSAYEEEEEYEEEGSEDDEDASDPRVEALSQNGLRLDQIDVLELLTKNSKYLSRLTDAKKPKGSGHASCIEQCGKAASLLIYNIDQSRRFSLTNQRSKSSWLHLISIAIQASQQDDLGSAMHPIHYGAALEYSDGSIISSCQKAGLEIVFDAN